jgi:hypothetical protein
VDIDAVTSNSSSDAPAGGSQPVPAPSGPAPSGPAPSGLASGPAPTGPVLRGTSEDARLALQLIAAAGRSGTVRFDDGRLGSLHVEAGSVCAVTPGVGRRLRDAIGLAVEDERWAFAAAELGHTSATPDGPPDEGAVAAVLVDSGELTAAVVQTAVLEVAVNLLFELLVLADVEFAFEVGAAHPLAGTITIDVVDLLDAVAQRIEDWKVIATEIPSTAAVPRLAPAFPPGLAELTLVAADWKVIGATDGQRTIADLTGQTALDAFDVCLSLHRLLQAGVVTID